MITKVEQMDEGQQIVFKKMFDAVGAPYDLEMVDDWYYKYEWTEEQENEFKEWFINYHWKGNGKKNGVLKRYACRTKRDCTKGWRDFNFMWGWKIKEE